jgi:hypothetical protein
MRRGSVSSLKHAVFAIYRLEMVGRFCKAHFTLGQFADRALWRVQRRYRVHPRKQQVVADFIRIIDNIAFVATNAIV